MHMPAVDVHVVVTGHCVQTSFRVYDETAYEIYIPLVHGHMLYGDT